MVRAICCATAEDEQIVRLRHCALLAIKEQASVTSRAMLMLAKR